MTMDGRIALSHPSAIAPCIALISTSMCKYDREIPYVLYICRGFKDDQDDQARRLISDGIDCPVRVKVFRLFKITGDIADFVTGEVNNQFCATVFTFVFI